MTVSSTQQLHVFFLCIAFGIFSGIVFDVQRSLRRVYGGKNALTITEDVLFSVVYIAALIILCYLFDEGRIRYYHLLGALCGVFLYALLLSNAVLKALCFIHMFFIRNILSPIVKLLRLIFSPIMVAFKKLLALMKRISGKFRRFLRDMKIKRKRLKKILKMF